MWVRLYLEVTLIGFCCVKGVHNDLNREAPFDVEADV